MLNVECLMLKAHTGLWLGYNGLRYGHDQVFAKSHRKNRNLARLEIYGRKKIGRNLFSLRDPLNCFGLVWIFSSLFPWAAELSAPRWRTLPVSHPAFTAGNRHSSGRGEHSWAVPVARSESRMTDWQSAPSWGWQLGCSREQRTKYSN